MRSFKGTFYSFFYPESWELEIIENIPSLFKPNGPGALIIVAFRYEDTNGVDTKRELLRYFYKRGIQVSENRITTYKTENKLLASAIEYIHEDRFWFANLVGKDHKYVLFLWNSDEIPNQELVQEISFIVKSIVYNE
ncbi:MAG: hypothetical protein ACK4UJ_00660 [Leptonema sp. (in: bacteria)]